MAAQPQRSVGATTGSINPAAASGSWSNPAIHCWIQKLHRTNAPPTASIRPMAMTTTRTTVAIQPQPTSVSVSPMVPPPLVTIPPTTFAVAARSEETPQQFVAGPSVARPPSAMEDERLGQKRAQESEKSFPPELEGRREKRSRLQQHQLEEKDNGEELEEGEVVDKDDGNEVELLPPVAGLAVLQAKADAAIGATEQLNEVARSQELKRKLAQLLAYTRNSLV